MDTFPSHDMFADLVVLKDKDVEADFFENIRHIQVHDQIFLKEKKCPTNQLILTDFVQHWLLQDVTFIHVYDRRYIHENILQ